MSSFQEFPASKTTSEYMAQSIPPNDPRRFQILFVLTFFKLHFKSNRNGENREGKAGGPLRGVT